MFNLERTDHGGASSKRGTGALVEVVSGRHAPVRHLEASVNIDATWDQHTAVSINGLHPTRNNEVLPDLPEEGVEERGRKREKRRKKRHSQRGEDTNTEISNNEMSIDVNN